MPQAGDGAAQPGKDDRAPGQTRFRIGVEAANARGLLVGNQTAVHPLFRFSPQPADFFTHTLAICQRILHLFQEERASKKIEGTSGKIRRPKLEIRRPNSETRRKSENSLQEG